MSRAFLKFIFRQISEMVWFTTQQHKPVHGLEPDPAPFSPQNHTPQAQLGKGMTATKQLKRGQDGGNACKGRKGVTDWFFHLKQKTDYYRQVQTRDFRTLGISQNPSVYHQRTNRMDFHIYSSSAKRWLQNLAQTRNESLEQSHNARGLDAATKVTVGQRNAVEQLPGN